MGKINLVKNLNKIFSVDKRKEGTDCRTIKEIESIGLLGFFGPEREEPWGHFVNREMCF